MTAEIDAMQIEESNLERALRLAANEPAHRPDFYSVLLNATIYVLGPPDQDEPSVRSVETGEKIFIQNWVRDDGSPIIPFFSSLSTLQRAIDVECSYLALPARAFFEITKGNTLVLNPKSQYGKEFFAGEIDALLSNGVNRLPEQRVTTKAAEVFLGEPQEYPSKMVDSLTTLLAKRSNVKAAYLLQMHEPVLDEKPRLVVGIDADGDVEQIMREAGIVAGDSMPIGESVDMMQVIIGEKGLSEYFLKEVKPFYERRWGALLQEDLGTGHA
jgi:hypothetical protein